MFLVASKCTHNANWIAVIESFQSQDAADYPTLLVGHGQNGGPSILAQDITYLNALETAMAKNLSKDDTDFQVIIAFWHDAEITGIEDTGAARVPANIPQFYLWTGSRAFSSLSRVLR